MCTTIALPERFDDASYVDVSEALSTEQYVKEVCIDFTPLKYSFPLPMLVIGSLLRDFVGIRKRNNLPTKAVGITDTSQVQGYLQHVGFFHFIGLPIGKDVGEAKGNARYLPIRRITRTQLTSEIGPN